MGLKLAFKAFFKALKEAPKEIAHEEDSSSHLRLLALLQTQARLVDFLKEEISGFSDAQIGSAVRKIHQDSSRCLEEFITLRPLFHESEGEVVTVPLGYDPSTIKVTGKVKGAPPYTGILRHKGWKAHKISLPKVSVEGDRSIVCPAEVEV